MLGQCNRVWIAICWTAEKTVPGFVCNMKCVWINLILFPSFTVQFWNGWQDPEENPYKSKYVAREMLELAATRWFCDSGQLTCQFFPCLSRFPPTEVKDLEKLITEEEGAQPDSAALNLGREVMARPGPLTLNPALVVSKNVLCRLLLFLGKNLYYCEEVPMFTIFMIFSRLWDSHRCFFSWRRWMQTHLMFLLDEWLL